MARGGVTYSEVDEAAQYLQGLGRNPTVDSIRERLGTGSRTTLAEHLKRWKALQADGEGRLPQPLLALVTGLWESLQAVASQRVQENQSIAHQEVAALKVQLHASQQVEIQLKQELHQIQEKRDKEQRTTSTLTQQLQIFQTDHDKLQTEHQLLLRQLEAAKQENQRLHQLANQIQANLEHYQQAIQQQQVEQQLAKGKQHSAFALEIAGLKHNLEETNARYHHTEKLLVTHEQMKKQAREKHDELSQRHEKLTQQYQSVQTENTELKTQHQLQEKYLEKCEADVTATKQLAQVRQEQVAVLNSQLQKAQADLQLSLDKIETLRQEKLFLVQEKSRLESTLKYFEQNKQVA